jgi:NAD(P)-dependent dehydrogenase (short-subunit alcohol dehydrogenase family)
VLRRAHLEPRPCRSWGTAGEVAKTMALELSEHAITVNSVAPGEIATPMTGQEDADVVGNGTNGQSSDLRRLAPAVNGPALVSFGAAPCRGSMGAEEVMAHAKRQGRSEHQETGYV